MVITEVEANLNGVLEACRHSKATLSNIRLSKAMVPLLQLVILPSKGTLLSRAILRSKAIPLSKDIPLNKDIHLSKVIRLSRDIIRMAQPQAKYGCMLTPASVVARYVSRAVTEPSADQFPRNRSLRM